MKNILNTINKYSENLSKVSKWHNSKELISEIITINTHQGQKDDFIYEFNCYIKIIIDLKKYYKIEFIKGSQTNYSFPKKPAKKEGKPFFIAENKFNKFQLCAGTKIKTKFNTKKAPDISFQYFNSPKNPTYKNIFMIFDAKYTNTEKKLSLNSFSYFVTMIKDLGLNNKIENIIQFNKFKQFDTNCILTNGKGLNENKKYHESHNIKVVEYFIQNKIFNVIG